MSLCQLADAGMAVGIPTGSRACISPKIASLSFSKVYLVHNPTHIIFLDFTHLRPYSLPSHLPSKWPMIVHQFVEGQKCKKRTLRDFYFFFPFNIWLDSYPDPTFSTHALVHLFLTWFLAAASKSTSAAPCSSLSLLPWCLQPLHPRHAPCMTVHFFLPSAWLPSYLLINPYVFPPPFMTTPHSLLLTGQSPSILFFPLPDCCLFIPFLLDPTPHFSLTLCLITLYFSAIHYIIIPHSSLFLALPFCIPFPPPDRLPHIPPFLSVWPPSNPHIFTLWLPSILILPASLP